MSAEPITPTDASGADAAAGGGPTSLWAPELRKLTFGLALTVTLVAFEALAIATVMPEVKDDLGGLALYGWVFSGFFLASLLGIVVSGELADRRGLLLPYAAGLGLFTLGLILGGAATSMPMLVAGRILQGFGAGAIPATAYTSIARGIPARLRPRMFAVLSTAWVVPGLIGPSAALGIEHATSWRAVFLVLVPITIVAGLLTVPALRALDRAGSAPSAPPGPSTVPMVADRPDPVGVGSGAEVDGDLVPTSPAPAGGQSDGPLVADAVTTMPESGRRLRLVGLLVLGVGACFAAGSGAPMALAVVLVAVGLPVAVWATRSLLPPGTFRLAAGVPASVGVRGILTFSFFAADAYVPLAVVDGRGGDAWIAGAALTLCTLLWTAGSWTQARVLGRVGPRRLDQTGFVLMVVSIAVLLLVARGAPVLLVIPAWGLGGLSIGMAYAPLAVTVLGSAAPGEEGAASAAIQLSDGLGIAVGTGLAGAAIAFADGRGWPVADGVTVVFAIALVGAAFGIFAAGRLPASVPRHD
jgi:MFS family permease